MVNMENYPREEVPGQEDENLNNTDPLSYEEQEQLNSNNLTQRIEEENQENPNYGDINETIDTPSQGEEDLSGFLERTIPGAVDPDVVGSDKPVTKNLLGDNPPGSEQAAFDSGHPGDMSKDQAVYNAENLKENFRENLDKTQSEIDLDKKIKNKQ